MGRMLAWRPTGLTPLDSRDNCANYLMRYQDTTNCRIIKILTIIKARVGVVFPMGAVTAPACNALYLYIHLTLGYDALMSVFVLGDSDYWQYSQCPSVRLCRLVKNIEYYIACLYSACCYLSVCQWRTMFIIQGRSFIHLAGEISLYHFFHANVIHFIHS